MVGQTILALAPIPPTRSGIAIYSWKFYSALSEKTKIELVTHLKENKSFSTNKKIKVIIARNLLSFIEMAIRKMKSKKIKVISYQLGLRSFHSHAFTLFFTALILTIKNLLGKKLAVTIHTFPTLNSIASVLKKYKWLAYFIYGVYAVLIKLVIRKADLIFVHSQLIKKKLEKQQSKFSNKIKVIPHGARYYKCKNGERKKGYNLLIHGFIRESKGIDELLKAIKILKQSNIKVNLNILGPTHMGEKRPQWLFDKIKELGLTDSVMVKIGFFSEKIIEEFICKSDIIILPYQDQFLEASGVLAKTIPSGKPIIVTRSPKFMIDKEVAKHLVFVEKPESRELAEKIKEVIESYDEVLEKSKRLQEIARKRDWKKVADRYLKVIRETTKDKVS